MNLHFNFNAMYLDHYYGRNGGGNNHGWRVVRCWLAGTTTIRCTYVCMCIFLYMGWDASSYVFHGYIS